MLHHFGRRVPGNAEQVVECGAELFHAGLIWAEGDVQDQTTASVFPPWAMQNYRRENIRSLSKHPSFSTCANVIISACVTRQEGQFLLEHGEDGGRFHVDVGHLQTRKTNRCFLIGVILSLWRLYTRISKAPSRRVSKFPVLFMNVQLWLGSLIQELKNSNILAKVVKKKKTRQKEHLKYSLRTLLNF